MRITSFGSICSRNQQSFAIASYRHDNVGSHTIIELTQGRT
jgi:hypothetical protein